MSVSGQTSNKITLQTLYNEYEKSYKPTEQEEPTARRDRWLDYVYEKYSEDYQKGVNGGFFLRMLDAADDETNECIVFEESVNHVTSVCDDDLLRLFTCEHRGKPSLQNLLDTALNGDDFDAQVIVHIGKCVIVTLSWSLS